MRVNTGFWDRAIRVVLGLAILIVVPSPWAWLGLVPLATALIGYCPLYHLLGISTCRVTARQQ